MKKYLLILALLLVVACTKEITTSCPAFQTVTHFYVLNSEDKDQMDTHMDSIKVLQFGADDVFMGVTFIDSPKNGQVDEITIIPPHNTLLSVGGEHSGFKFLDATTSSVPLIGKTKLQDIEIHLLHQDFVAGTPSELFMSEPVVVEAESLESGHTDIAMIEKTKTITVHLIGAGDSYTTSILMDNGILGYDGFPIAQPTPMTYLPSVSYNADTVSFEFEVVRLFANDSTGVVVIDPTGASNLSKINATTIPVVGTIMKNPQFQTQSDLDKQSNYNFALRVKGGVVVSVSINDWEIVSVEI